MRTRRLGALGLMLTLGCQLKPTVVHEQLENKKIDGSVVESKLVILDARPATEYLLSHLQGSYSVQWQDFSQVKAPFQGLLDPDLFYHARRLARYGITPQSQVVVVGNGLRGKGEEGRVAWTLKVLGISNVRISSLSQFSIPFSTQEPPPPANAAIWKPELQNDWLVEKAEFFEKLKPPRQVVLIDVRPEDEFLEKRPSALGKKIRDLGAINIPWTEFLDEKGEPNSPIQGRLKAIGIDSEKEILVIDNEGVRSGLATFVLRELGFSRARNFAGGYRML